MGSNILTKVCVEIDWEKKRKVLESSGSIKFCPIAPLNLLHAMHALSLGNHGNQHN